jgi:hypothetical protein
MFGEQNLKMPSPQKYFDEITLCPALTSSQNIKISFETQLCLGAATYINTYVQTLFEPRKYFPTRAGLSGSIEVPHYQVLLEQGAWGELVRFGCPMPKLFK